MFEILLIDIIPQYHLILFDFYKTQYLFFVFSLEVDFIIYS